MQAIYEVNVKFTVFQEIDSLKECENLKSNDEFATDLCLMVCDEASTCGTVATYEIIESKIDVK